MLAFVCEMVTEWKVWKFDGKEDNINLDADRKEWFFDRDECEIMGHENVKKAVWASKTSVQI